MDTSQFDATLVYAVCYTSAYGNASGSWVDTALRVTVSMVTALHFGTGVPYPGPRMIYPKNVIDLYHGTSAHAVPSIMGKGLTPTIGAGGEALQEHHGVPVPGVYLARSWQVATTYPIEPTTDPIPQCHLGVGGGAIVVAGLML